MTVPPGLSCWRACADTLGQQCAPKRNLTWGLHWLSTAEQLGQPDAQAMMGFLHASDALRDVYDFSGLEPNRTHARVLFERAAAGGSAFGAMAIGFRYAHGIGVRESCPEGAAWYEQAAKTAINKLTELSHGFKLGPIAPVYID